MGDPMKLPVTHPAPNRYHILGRCNIYSLVLEYK